MTDIKEGLGNVVKNPDKRIGTMRIDWNDGLVSNSWFPTEYFDKCKAEGLDIATVQKEINKLIFNKYLKYETVLDTCNGEGYDKETHLHCIGQDCNYGIRLIPVRTAYSYIYVYKR